MFHNHQIFKTVKKHYKKNNKKNVYTIKKQLVWLLRTLFVTKKRRRVSANAGFVLPTVAMVALVVVLLTTAILFRSFERSKNASNVRVNQAVISAASPALSRAKAKIEQLFRDPTLPRSTPSDTSLYNVLTTNITKYTFGDETPLKLSYDNDKNNIINTKVDLELEDREIIDTGWRFPVDTDNNGKYDSYTLYNIYLRSPSRGRDGKFNRARNPLDARTPPMDEGAVGTQCQSQVSTSANLVSTQGWYKVGSKLKKSIFVYTTTVPITESTGLDTNKYEKFTGNKGFVALEYQQDRERIPLNNNAVIYEDDLEIAPGAGISLNGRIFTNGNLLTRAENEQIRFYLVSSAKSCYFKEENSKIVVAGNVINSRVNESSSGNDVKVDLFDQSYKANSAIATSVISNTNKTVPTSVYGNTAAYNDEAYAKRIDRLVQATNSQYPNNADLPDEVQQEIARDLADDSTLNPAELRNEKLRIYFRKRTRRVPYAEIPEIASGGNPLKYGSYNYEVNSPLQGSGNSLRPVDMWVFPFNPADGKTASNYAEIGISENGSNKLYLSATDPIEQVKANKEQKIGDRILVGNNLPQYWFDTTKGKFVSSPDEGQTIAGKEWDVNKNGGNSTVTRKRFSQAYQLDNLGVTDRDDFWEKSAAQQPQGPLDVVGGLRVVTGAGIYLPNGYSPSSTTAQFNSAIAATDKVWADTMPMGVTSTSQGLPNSLTPYLQMRATAVYHYQNDSYNPKNPTDYQSPIACVSSYYDPTNSKTATNREGLPDIRQRVTTPASISSRPLELTNRVAAADAGNSNNGVVYSVSSLSTTGYDEALKYQAKLKYPNGRWVNEPLQKALSKIAVSKPLSLAEQSAVDSTMCALKIVDSSISPTDTIIPHGAIMETAFLDARQIKAIDKPSTTSATTYDLDVELRQPLEIRATVLDLDLLRRKSKTGGEFLFPNSGIIYATRDDALADQSDLSKDVSATDFKLDPTRRPNAIMLINSSNLSRNSTYKPEEKGLILVSNLPVYIKGNFNVHTQEEFTDNSLKEEKNWSSKFYARQALNPNFACRQGQFSGCNTGESWRPAAVIADAITVLSDNFRLGFREEGDYDLRNNYDLVDKDSKPIFISFDANGDGSLGTVNESDFGFDLNGNGTTNDTSVSEASITASAASKINGFWDNNFVTSRTFTDSDYSTDSRGTIGSSYFNNFVTPIQRRVKFSEYVMEICRKSTVILCKPDDWVVGYDANDDGILNESEKNIKAYQLIAQSDDSDPTASVADPLAPNTRLTRFGAGTTAQAAMLEEDRRYPRRVAFLRDANNNLRLFSNSPVLIGISSTGKVNYYPYFETLTIDGKKYSAYSTSNQPNSCRTSSNALWFRTRKVSTSPQDNYDPLYPLWIENLSSLTGKRPTEQPLLVPVLQIQYPLIPSASDKINDGGDAKTNGNWMQTATNTETNLIFAQGNTPGRPRETNGGLENLVRYLERWEKINHTATGSFIQFKRSSYATAPWQIVTAGFNNTQTGYSNSGTIFGYPQGYRLTVTPAPNQNLGRSPFFTPPSRFWGYDVALLSQLPDLFSQRFTTPTTNEPNEFFREVARDDAWVKTLLCAQQANGSYAISSDQRGICP
ncbi:hypothetical protein BZZ01_29655 [Nostocales cyanobacterium HT-58-2]|nr:hypothetical protein BZZ01_29655 [Nostocales cyanobacterium HT-58-2]